MTIWERMATALAGLGVPASAGRYLPASGVAKPALYLVYRVVDDPPTDHCDDVETAREYNVQVTAYSVAGLNALPDVETAMLAAGFTRTGGRELDYNETSGHWAWMWEFSYYQQE